ncbi:MAG: large conductance mechanosensitive channel protein MscL [Leptolyngbyaceae cyanobacterium RM1_406_9]|nr:large conductance mechanosensitive channel protein MscL [Leptolyngbyaceae cyanobacterium RM1_406_9]
MAIRRSRSAAGGFLRDFREFALKGNVIDLAIAVIIGGAFGKIVTSFVQDLVMPLVSLFIPGGDWRTARIVLAAGTPGVEGSEKAILIGSFLGAIVDFIIIAFVIYLAIRALARFKRQEEVAEAEAAPADPVVVSQEKLTSALDRLTQTLESRG